VLVVAGRRSNPTGLRGTGPLTGCARCRGIDVVGAPAYGPEQKCESMSSY
jgi:hypothetical protein